MAKKLFCVPYAGGNAAVFKRLGTYFEKASVEVIPFEYAGHGIRIRENFSDSIEEIGKECAEFIKKNIVSGDEIYILGYSMGSLVAYEAILILENKCDITVKSFFAAANQAPCTKETVFDDYENDGDIEKDVIELGGFDKKLLTNKRYMSMILPVIKNDFSILNRYRKSIHLEKLKVPVVVMRGKTDIHHQNLDDWKLQTIAGCEFMEFSTGHFFMLDEMELMADRMLNVICNE